MLKNQGVSKELSSSSRESSKTRKFSRNLENARSSQNHQSSEEQPLERLDGKNPNEKLFDEFNWYPD